MERLFGLWQRKERGQAVSSTDVGQKLQPHTTTHGRRELPPREHPVCKPDRAGAVLPSAPRDQS